MKTFYHTDMDGHCSGAIAYMASGNAGKLYPINYNIDFPFAEIEPDEQVVIVDFSIQTAGGFEKLLEITKNVIWIDHHKTAIEKNIHLKYTLPGLRRDGTAACELCWEYFFPNLECPEAVKLIGDYDVWTFKYGDRTNQFQVGARLSNTHPDSEVWTEWFTLFSDLEPLLEKGKVILTYRDRYYASLVKSWAYPVEFEGYKGIACNAGSVSSQLFDSIEKPYDILIAYIFDGFQYTVSLYTQSPEIGVSIIAKKYGGGGHRQASGFQCKTLPFIRVKNSE